MINLPPVRLYGEDGCPFCQQAVQFFQNNRIPIQGIAVDEDPIIIEGAKFWLRKAQSLPCDADLKASIPVVVSFLNPKEVLLGYNEDGYKRIVEAYRAFISASAGNFAVSVSADPEPAKELAQEPAPTSETVN